MIWEFAVKISKPAKWGNGHVLYNKIPVDLLIVDAGSTTLGRIGKKISGA